MSGNSSTPNQGINCDPSYSYVMENFKYFVQVAYLAPAVFLYSRILYVVWVQHKKSYGYHPFFMVYSMVGLILVLLDIFITRLFVYVPQLCLPAAQFFISNPFLMELYYPLLNYLHCAQPFIQIFLTTNRMSSVLWPVDHEKFWKINFSRILILNLIAPFFFIWNTIISKKVLIFYFGGFYINYLKIIPWASMSLFLFIIRSAVVMITVVTTSITFWKMSHMKNRLKKSEGTLCKACAANSICFLVPAVFEAMKVLNTDWGKHWLAYLVQPFAWDVLNVGSPLVMIFASGQLRTHAFNIKRPVLKRSNSILVSSMTN
ncbi:Serpentine receptor class gamma-8 [Caenorhabditis elegans]|uniref:Serpentine receptor class gamma-8 n=1 Tax=Caenorhabditis elegans TaxID=6239 RepID=SRG8_CAEEL|nr:Serpentine receptor class gamma-8 [Caenorhabditis elegans]P46565.1 RecName: Full=Serpentine receptor class gamma-8; Short=Protein srg-8 [Caenorhabditis elegans]CCD65215.1 Serpentine receptor class gamma-8 [Caenorhabditis elegans]|eukprot:NP_498364.1 Serpentine receptor class gamma-8 [Caenorhabditis elegans]